MASVNLTRIHLVKSPQPLRSVLHLPSSSQTQDVLGLALSSISGPLRFRNMTQIHEKSHPACVSAHQ